MESNLKHIDIVIATRNRYEKLKKMLKSIPDEPYIETMIICDGEDNTLDKVLEEAEIMEKLNIGMLYADRNHKGAVFCRNYAIQYCEDGILYATDDMTFEPNAVENAFNAFNRKFPDDDGVVGFIQIPDNFHPTGVALVGQKFLQRYPNKKLFWPGYYHFACQEVYWLASKLGKFHQEKTAVIRHYHPDFFKNEMDETHREARIHRQKDHDLIMKRMAKGLIWGES